ncbi:MAG: single-stranded-DNA-specific exonuclease RecJ [Bacillota bacterium]
MPAYQWHIKSGEPELERLLIRECALSPLLARLLINRGVGSPEEVRSFLDGTLSDLPPSGAMRDLDACVVAIREAIASGETVLVYGDYDVDGMTATAVLVKAIRHLGGRAVFYLPTRADGYGVHLQALAQAREQGVNLVVTVDCGVTAVKEVIAAGEMGLRIIITDHHQPKGDLPATLTVNPKRPDCCYPFKDLAGAGVALKVATALLGDRRNKINEIEEELLGLACLGTIADVVPLVGENRIIVRLGLPFIRKNVGLAALASAARLPAAMTVRDVACGIAPKLNAAGRLDSAALGVELLLADDPSDAGRIADELLSLNAVRKDLEDRVSSEVMAAVSEWSSVPPVAVFAGEGWHPGVTSVVASRLADKLNIPVVLMAVEGEAARGSARSPYRFNMFHALEQCQSYLTEFGGHRNAAGFVLPAAAIGEFVRAIQEHAVAMAPAEGPILEIDAQIVFDDLTEELVQEIERLSPWGNGNPQPVFCARNLRVVRARLVGKDQQHLKLTVAQGARRFEAIAFGFGKEMGDIASCPALDLAFRPEINEWNGHRSLELRVIDWREGDAFPRRVTTGSLYRKALALRDVILPNIDSDYWLAKDEGIRAGSPSRIFDLRDMPDRMAHLRKLVHEKTPAFIAVSTRDTAPRLALGLGLNDGKAAFLHPHLPDPDREQIVKRWLAGEIPVLVAQPLDLPEEARTERVIVYDLLLTWSDWLTAAGAGKELYLLHAAVDQERNRLTLKTIAPNRRVIGCVYTVLRKGQGRRLTVERLAGSVQRLVEAPVAPWTVRIGLTVLAELGVLSWIEDDGGRLEVDLGAVAVRRGLGCSPTFRLAHRVKRDSLACQKYFALQPADDLRIFFGVI